MGKYISSTWQKSTQMKIWKIAGEKRQKEESIENIWYSSVSHIFSVVEGRKETRQRKIGGEKKHPMNRIRMSRRWWDGKKSSKYEIRWKIMFGWRTNLAERIKSMWLLRGRMMNKRKVHCLAEGVGRRMETLVGKASYEIGKQRIESNRTYDLCWIFINSPHFLLPPFRLHHPATYQPQSQPVNKSFLLITFPFVEIARKKKYADFSRRTWKNVMILRGEKEIDENAIMLMIFGFINSNAVQRTITHSPTPSPSPSQK